MSKIAIIGTGYVGLTSGACLAHLGHEVVCGDIDLPKIALLAKGIVPIHERGLAKLVNQGLKAKRLRFVADATTATAQAEFVFLCVPTPLGADGALNLSALQAAATEVGRHASAGAVVVNKSTVPVGSTRLVEQALGRSDLAVVSNPEFLREGNAVNDFLKPARIVIGSDNPNSASKVAKLYQDMTAPIICTDPTTAETAKYAANAFLATKVTFINTIAAVCEAVGADVDDVALALGHDPRIGSEYLAPGPGWGGSCFPKDTQALVKMAADAGYDYALLREVLAANEAQFEIVVSKAASLVALRGATVALLGIAFKAGTDDTRNSPALTIASMLLAQGALLRAYDPVVTEVDSPDIVIAGDLYAACECADLAIVLTEWEEFKTLDIGKLAQVMAARNVLDARNILDREMLLNNGFVYQGIGRR